MRKTGMSHHFHFPGVPMYVSHSTLYYLQQQMHSSNGILGIAYHATNITSHHLSFQATLVYIVNCLLISSKLYSHEQVRSLCSSVCSSLMCSTEKYIAHFFRIASFHRNSQECSRGENQYWRNANIKIACTSYLRQEETSVIFLSPNLRHLEPIDELTI